MWFNSTSLNQHFGPSLGTMGRVLRTGVQVPQIPKVTRTNPILNQNRETGEQTSVGQDSKSPDSSVLSLSGRQTGNGQSFFENPDTGQNRDRQNPDRQTSDRIFYKIPDRIRTADRIETGRIRTDRHRTENPDRIQTPDRHRTDLSGKFRQRIATG